MPILKTCKYFFIRARPTLARLWRHDQFSRCQDCELGSSGMRRMCGRLEGSSSKLPPNAIQTHRKVRGRRILELDQAVRISNIRSQCGPEQRWFKAFNSFKNIAQ